MTMFQILDNLTSTCTGSRSRKNPAQILGEPGIVVGLLFGDITKSKSWEADSDGKTIDSPCCFSLERAVPSMSFDCFQGKGLFSFIVSELSTSSNKDFDVSFKSKNESNDSATKRQ